MIEQWIQWKLIDGLMENQYPDDVEAIFQTAKGLEIILCRYYVEDIERKRIRCTFDRPVIAYRSTYETFRCNSGGPYGFFKVKNSDYVQWVAEQSHGTLDSTALTHISFYTDDVVVDIICEHEPKVEILEGD